jgi:hypothetical protein
VIVLSAERAVFLVLTKKGAPHFQWEFDPVRVQYLEDAKVTKVLEVLGVNRSRDEVIAALERSNWENENRAINELLDPR